MKHLLMLAPLFFSTAIAQSTAKNRKFEFGVSVSNDIGYRTLKHNDTDPSNDFILEQRNDREEIKYCYSAGLTIAYTLNVRARISTGILYSNKGYQTEKLSLQSAFPDPEAPNKFQLRYNMNYIDVPLIFNYRFGQKKKLRFSIGAGVGTNIFLKEVRRSILYYDDKTERESSETEFDYIRINLSPQVEFGVIFDAHDLFYLSARPTFSYGLLKIIDAPITAYLFTGGINVGIHLK